METILNTSEEAAKFVENISGWVSRKGMFSIFYLKPL